MSTGEVRRTVLAHRSRNDNGEETVLAASQAAIELPSRGFWAETGTVSCEFCGDEIPVRLYSARRLMFERAIAAFAAALLLAVAVVAAFGLLADQLSSAEPFQTSADRLTPVMATLVPGALGMVMARRSVKVSAVKLQMPPVWNTTSGNRHSFD